MLRESFEGGLIDPHDDVAHLDETALCSRLPGKQLFNPHHTGAGGFVRDVLLPTETEAQTRRVLQQAHVKHIICGDNKDMQVLFIGVLLNVDYLTQTFVGSPRVTKLYSGLSLT